MIEFQNVNFAYEKDHPVLKDLSFRIEKGEAVGLIGANGAGKSTVMKLLLGLLEGEGKIIVDGVEVRRDTLAQIRRKLGFVLQNSDNQMFMPTVYEDMIFAPLNYMLSREEADARVDAVLKRLHLEDLKHRYNHKISGGEKKMAAIATILAMEPDAVLMDEPTSSLDPYNSGRPDRGRRTGPGDPERSGSPGKAPDGTAALKTSLSRLPGRAAPAVFYSKISPLLLNVSRLLNRGAQFILFHITSGKYEISFSITLFSI